MNITSILRQALSSALIIGCAVFNGPVSAADRFLIQGEEVIDTATGLVWQRCPLGQTLQSERCEGAMQLFTWDELSYLIPWGYRVPNVKELDSLIDRSRYNLAIDPDAFPFGSLKTTFFWSSTPSFKNQQEPEYANMAAGVSLKTGKVYVYLDASLTQGLLLLKN